MIDAIFTTDGGRKKLLWSIGAIINEADWRVDTMLLPTSKVACLADGVRTTKELGTGKSGGNKAEFLRLVDEQIKLLLPPISKQLDEKVAFYELCRHYRDGATYNWTSYWFEPMPDYGSVAYRERMAAIAKVVEADAAAARNEVQAISVLQQLAILFQAVARNLPPAPVKLRDLDMPF